MPMIDGRLWRSEEDLDYFWHCVVFFGTGFKKESLAGWVTMKPQDVLIEPSEKED